MVGSASNTMTLRPVCAMTIAAASPFGPDPTTMASGWFMRCSTPSSMPDALPGYWYSRLVFERALALIYLVAFLCAANQFVPLLGEHGLMPASRFIKYVPFRASPSLFFFAPGDGAFRLAAWAGVALACLAFAGAADRLHPLG